MCSCVTGCRCLSLPCGFEATLAFVNAPVECHANAWPCVRAASAPSARFRALSETHADSEEPPLIYLARRHWIGVVRGGPAGGGVGGFGDVKPATANYRGASYIASGGSSPCAAAPVGGELTVEAS